MLFQKQNIALLVFLFLTLLSNAQVSVCSWNLMNFGKSKSDNALEFIANTLNSYDIVAIQEVVAGPGGAQKVADLVNILNRKGFHWDYEVSAITTSDNPSSRERYAFLWKSSQVKKIGKGWLEQTFQKEIDREPFMSTFEYKGKQFTIASFHAVPKKKHPESEIKYFKQIPCHYPKLHLLFTGDFNCPQSHSVFTPLKNLGYSNTLTNQKTSLRQKCINDDCLASEYDNMFYDNRSMKLIKSEVVLFYKSFSTLKQAHKISDHIPNWSSFDVK
ncbi:endonuclease/exonuclease/phosphatase family protein [Flavobacterium aciduliphilum]|uniref:Endonuclease/exonuclease/phosphatase family protein n=1 Tax=Flavobacterium aciduliphilum TaxID=1101402 RepID=A0A328YKD0_9FLAO|nr:endonuclease/exonuclease/phosphatase family protein [Flavobacterium aciduliphilum]RAR73764.1 endonuclease/exonuclease/phosphatase family protein [Flavobacterium aciduliphilum]